MVSLMKISFFVDCPPVGQPRQRHALLGGQVRNYTPSSHPVVVFKSRVCIAARRAYQGTLLDGPLRVSMLFLLPRPKRLIWKMKPMPREWATCKPDFDNASKAIADALNGVLWLDDALLCDVVIRKMYAAGGESAGVEVEIENACHCLVPNY